MGWKTILLRTDHQLASEAEVLLGERSKVTKVARRVGIVEHTSCRKRKEAELFFIAGLRDELLDRKIFDTLPEARILMENRRMDYNRFRRKALQNTAHRLRGKECVKNSLQASH